MIINTMWSSLRVYIFSVTLVFLDIGFTLLQQHINDCTVICVNYPKKNKIPNELHVHVLVCTQ